MIEMIIADDEFNIRQGLLTIPWNDLGIEIVGVASNGEEALSMVKDQHPDILLTDIRMPKLDGLKLIEAAIKEIASIKTILLTGYQDFNYAHTAIKLGAYGYVLKPSDPDEIIEIVLKAKKQIELEDNKKRENEHIRNEFDSNKHLIMNSFLFNLLYGRYNDAAAINKKCSALHLELENYIVMVLEFEIQDDNNNLIFQLKEEALNISSGFYKSYSVDVNHSTLCIINDISKDKQPTKQEMVFLASEIRSAVRTNYSQYVSIGISRSFGRPEDMSAAFNQALNCLKMKFSLGKGAIIHIEDLADSIKRQDDLPLNLDDEILENIKIGNYNKVEKLAREFLFRLAKEQNSSEQVIKSICFSVLSRSVRIAETQGQACFREYAAQLNSIFTCCKDVGELEEFFISTLMSIMDSIHTKNCASKNKAITGILDYIEKSYMNDISLLTLSEHIHMNHIYISRLIKRETGETFLDILTSRRMKKACELLQNPDMKTYEISTLVGIKDSGYFSQVFKKFSGSTPSEYREKFLSRLKPKYEAAE